MAKVQKIKNKIKNSNQARNRIIFISILIIAIVLWLSPTTLKLMAARKTNQRLNKELVQVKMQNEKLKKTISKLHSNEYIELEARKQLGYVKPGEKAYIVIEKNVPLKKKAPVKKSWWERTVDYWKGIF